MPQKAVTLFEPPPLDKSKAAIENVLELTPVSDIGPDVFTNTRPLWHPPGARGIYGGAAIAQCLSAAQRTVPSNFTVHSMHCYFVLAGDSQLPVLYHVERVRDGNSYITRTVQARQKGRPIFTTTISFNREGNGGKKKVEHAIAMPDVQLPEEDSGKAAWLGGRGPFHSSSAGIVNRDSIHPEEKRVRQFVKARGQISPSGGHQAHLSALAYMSDSYFIGTITRVHDISRFGSKQDMQRAISSLKDQADSEDTVKRYIKEVTDQEEAELGSTQRNNTASRKQLSMMVSLDHTIYFHNPRAFKADEWIFTEMKTPWAGEGRGLVMQKMWSKNGVLVATCVQEGVVRLKQDDDGDSSKAETRMSKL